MKTQKTTRSYIEVDIADITSAAENIRDAVPRLTKEGHGIFQGTEKNKQSLVSLALSEDTNDKRQYIDLIDKHEPDIKALADNMATMGLLEPIRVRPTDPNGYDLIFGCRRCLAWLYNHAKAAGKVPARITAEAVESEGQHSLLTSLSENIRVEPSPIDEAKSFKKLEKNFGMKPKEIASAMGKDVKLVSERLRLLKLPPDIQEKVHLRKMGIKKAIALLGGDKDKVNTATSENRRVPPIKEIEKLYKSPQSQLPEAYQPFITEDVRQLFAFWLGIKYEKNMECSPSDIHIADGQCA